MSLLFQPAGLASGSRLTNAIDGGVLSMRTEGDVNVAVLPARSATVTPPLTLDPSAPSTRGLGIDVEATPDSASSGANGIATSVRFQPLPFAGGICARYCSDGG